MAVLYPTTATIRTMPALLPIADEALALFQHWLCGAVLARSECLQQLAAASVVRECHAAMKGAASQSQSNEHGASVQRIPATCHQSVLVQDIDDARQA